MKTTNINSLSHFAPGKAKAYLIGGGIASLAVAVYLVREAHMSGKNIHILEQVSVSGGALDGSGGPDSGYLIRGGRMHEKHFVCTWDLLSQIPTIEDPDKSVTDEIFEFSKKILTCSAARLLRAGEKVDVSSYGLSNCDKVDMLKLRFSSEEVLSSIKIEDWFSAPFFDTVFWHLWSTTFAFQKWSSVAEMRRYFIRFIHLLPDFNELGGIMRTVYNQYDSVVLPVEKWLREQGVSFMMNKQVTDIDFDTDGTKMRATSINYLSGGREEVISLTEYDYLFVTLGSMVDGASTGSMSSPASINEKHLGGAWELWEKIAKKGSSFGRPSAFCSNIELSKWMSFTVTLKDPTFFEHMEAFTGNVAGSGGLVTFTDSNWLMSIVLAHQPHFREQPEDVFVFWGDGLLPDSEGNFVKKRMSDCTGEEILIELFSHLKIMEKMDPLIEKANCIPCMMPFIDAQFFPRVPGDRPKVLPDCATNFAFLGQFVEVPEDCVFTVEYSVRTAQTAVFSLLGLDRKPTPIYRGSHDICVLLDALNGINR